MNRHRTNVTLIWIGIVLGVVVFWMICGWGLSHFVVG